MVEGLYPSIRQARSVQLGATGPISLSEPACRFSIRMREGDVAAVSAAAGLRFDMPVNRWTEQRNGFIARLGPEEWLLVGAEADADQISSELSKALSRFPSALVDISHRQVAFRVAGPNVEWIINSGCPLDLHSSAAPVGFATRTLLGKSEIILVKLGEPVTYRVECWRSFSTYVHGFLLEAARDCSASD